MPVKVEQIDSKHNIVLDYDERLSPQKLKDLLKDVLGENLSFDSNKRPVFRTLTGKNIVLFVRNISYLGIPHPSFKKRIQIPTEFKKEATAILAQKNYEVRYVGIYSYKELYLFVDFETTRYLQGKSHNSSAHVYVNDLYQALVHGIFSKTDAMGNQITTVLARNFKSYLEGKKMADNAIFSALHGFNQKFPFNKWITAQQAIMTMHNKNWSQWKQTEWAGWFLEYLFDTHVKNKKLSHIFCYTGNKNKSHKIKDLDFDVTFYPQGEFYGDLKASDIEKKECPANDQNALLEAINQYGRFWFLIYEHKTVKDKDKGSTMAA